MALLVCMCVCTCVNMHSHKENEPRECLLSMPYGYDNYAYQICSNLISTKLRILYFGKEKRNWSNLTLSMKSNAKFYIKVFVHESCFVLPLPIYLVFINAFWDISKMINNVHYFICMHNFKIIVLLFLKTCLSGKYQGEYLLILASNYSIADKLHRSTCRQVVFFLHFM